MQHKIFCVREFIKTESATAVQHVFLFCFDIQPPMRKSICHWNHQFEQIGCLCKGKSSGWPRVSEENVRRIQESFEHSPRKSTRRASRELGIPQPTVWRVLRRRLLFKPYCLQLVQALRPNDKWKHVEFCDCMLQNMEDDTFLPCLIFSDEAMCRLSGKVNWHKYGDYKIPKKHWNLRGTPRNLICLVLYCKQRFMDRSFLLKTWLLG